MAEPTLVKITEMGELLTPGDGVWMLAIDLNEPLEIDQTKKIAYAKVTPLLRDQMSSQAVITGQTAGDLFYADAADSMARLAKGGVGQVLKMAAGGEEPEWGSPFKAFNYMEQSTSRSTTSTSPVDVAGATLNLVMPSAGRIVAIAGFAMSIQNDVNWGGGAYLYIGAVPGQRTFAFCDRSGATGNWNSSFLINSAEVAAGTHTIKMTHYVENAAVTNYINRVNIVAFGF